MPFSTDNEEKRDETIKEVMSKISKADNRNEEGLRIVVAGKGGVGKTTISAILSYIISRSGKKVLAVDEDPQMNLPFALGIDSSTANNITPLNKHLDYIEEKTGARPGEGWGMFIKLNPEVDDVVERFGVDVTDNLKLLVMGTISKPDIGCACPENDLLSAVMNHISLKRNEIIVLDTEAGLEHFGRAIAKGFRHAIIVSEPTFNSFYVAEKAGKLSKDLGIGHVHYIFNKIRNGEERKRCGEFAKKIGEDNEFVYLPFDNLLYESEPSVLKTLNAENETIGVLSKLLNTIYSTKHVT